MVEAGEMPLPSYLWGHRNASLSRRRAPIWRLGSSFQGYRQLNDDPWARSVLIYLDELWTDIRFPPTCARRSISRCDLIRVFRVLDSVEGEMLGHVDQGLGHYADAFSFPWPTTYVKSFLLAFYLRLRLRVFRGASVPGQRRRVDTQVYLHDRSAEL